MAAPKRTSISRKLTWMNMFVSGSALLLACAGFIFYDMMALRDGIVRNLSTQAQVIGSNSTSALLFNDPQAAGNTLSALKADPDILSAVVYTADGQPFASYSRDLGSQIPPMPSLPAGQLEAHWRTNKDIVLGRSIVFQGKPTGTVYVRSDLEGLKRRFASYGEIAAVLLLGSLLAALAVSAIFQRSVTKPIVHLAQIAGAVSHDKNYSIRATPIGDQGEISVLIHSFNEMLGQIDRNERELLKARDDLEHRVKERTAQLQTAKDELEAYSQTILHANEELERASKFKDQFLSTMSHELRTPLNAVLGFSDLLKDERYGPLNDRQQRYIKHIHTGGKHLLSLINDILDLSKIEAGRLQLAIDSVSVAHTFREVLDTMRPLADKNSQTLLQEAPADLTVRADSTRFRQILMNLMGNAIKFTPAGGKIELAVRRELNLVRIDVRDNGPGIPEDEQKRIFEAFYRLRRSEKGEGTGLGLAITQRLVELHGGELGLESDPGRGSCFYFTLPLAVAVQPTEPVAAPAMKPLTSTKILVVEDDRTAATLLETQLTSAGYNVGVCTDPALAVETVAAMQPAAVTVDIVMKPVNGWEVLAQLKTDPRTSHIPVIVVSIVDQRSTGALLGADEYVVKPVEKSLLLAAVERCLLRAGVETHRSVLVVEDDAPTREFIADSLSQHGFSVETAADGEQARARLERELPKLVILDLILPKVSGFQLLAEWRITPRTADLPVFILTSKELTVEERKYLECNSAALFQKQERWQEALFKQLQRTMPFSPVEKS